MISGVCGRVWGYLLCTNVRRVCAIKKNNPHPVCVKGGKGKECIVHVHACYQFPFLSHSATSVDFSPLPTPSSPRFLFFTCFSTRSFSPLKLEISLNAPRRPSDARPASHLPLLSSLSCRHQSFYLPLQKSDAIFPFLSEGERLLPAVIWPAFSRSADRRPRGCEEAAAWEL